MARSYSKQSAQRGAALAVGWGRNALSLFALLACLLSLILVLQNERAPQLAAVLDSDMAAASVSVLDGPDDRPQEKVQPPLDGRARALAVYLSKRYRVSRDAMQDFVAAAFHAAQATRTDPLLILAVMAVESRFNPVAESVMGAQGLMQVIPKHHPDKFKVADGEVDVLDPETNILAGARILREYLAGSEDLYSALRRYGGGVTDVDNLYANKVLGERDRLQQVLRSGPGRAVAQSKPAARADGGGAETLF